MESSRLIQPLLLPAQEDKHANIDRRERKTRHERRHERGYRRRRIAMAALILIRHLGRDTVPQWRVQDGSAPELWRRVDAPLLPAQDPNSHAVVIPQIHFQLDNKAGIRRPELRKSTSGSYTIRRRLEMSISESAGKWPMRIGSWIDTRRGWCGWIAGLASCWEIAHGLVVEGSTAPLGHVIRVLVYVEDGFRGASNASSLTNSRSTRSRVSGICCVVE